MKARANKIILLVSSLGALLALGAAAYRENFLQDWRRVQRRYRAALPAAAAADFRVQLRQIVVPQLNATDRCVTCHVGMAPGESGAAGDRLFARHPNVGHDPADFGCTVCHGGQGRATETAAAHGNVRFWPEPMIPPKYASAGCGTCHTHLAVPDLATLEAGRGVFERRDCLACHRLDGRGGTLRTSGAGGMEGPDLSRVGGTGYDAGWYDKHLEHARAGGDSRWVQSFGEIPAGELAALAEFLKSRVGAPGLVEDKALFNSKGCRGCHKVGGVGGEDGPDLTLEGQRDPGRLDFTHVRGEPTLANWLKEHFRVPSRVVPGSLMPELGLSEEEIDRLTGYMLSLRRSNVPEAWWPKDRIEAERFGAREFGGSGAALYGTFCAACHGPAGEGMRYGNLTPFPAIANPDFLALASDDFLRATIVNGRPGRRMAAWGAGGTLKDADITAVIGHLRGLGGNVQPEGDPRPPRWVTGDAASGRRLYAANCARCHGAAGQGGEGIALNNPVLLRNATDTYLMETIGRGRRGTTMRGFGVPSTVSQALSPGEMAAIVAFLRTWEVKP